MFCAPCKRPTPGKRNRFTRGLAARRREPRSKGRRDAKGANWRFRVPDGEKISFDDGFFGSQQFQAGRDFGDFVVWRRDDVPSYQLAVVVDDAAMKITEVVRGADLLLSTARQLLLYRALELTPPAFITARWSRTTPARGWPNGMTR